MHIYQLSPDCIAKIFFFKNPLERPGRNPALTGCEEVEIVKGGKEVGSQLITLRKEELIGVYRPPLVCTTPCSVYPPCGLYPVFDHLARSGSVSVCLSVYGKRLNVFRPYRNKGSPSTDRI